MALLFHILKLEPLFYHVCVALPVFSNMGHFYLSGGEKHRFYTENLAYFRQYMIFDGKRSDFAKLLSSYV